MRKACINYGWIDRVPYIRRLKESEGRLRYLTTAEADLLINTCVDPIKSIVLFAIHTGLRKSNVLGLEWEQVDLGRGVCWIYPDQHKNGQARTVSLNSTALNVLQSRWELADNPEYVFSYRGKRLKTIRGGFENACRRAKLSNVTLHTLRHTYASWLAQSNVSTRILQELGGWKSEKMAKRYSHFSDDSLRQYQGAWWICHNL